MAYKRWRDLSPAYRKRLERQGVTGRTHRRTNLESARGHVSTRVTGAIDVATLDRVLRGQGTREEVTGTALLRTFTWPSWVPREVTNQQNGFTYDVEPSVAAALSRFPHPRTWRDVEFRPRGEDEPWEMVVWVKRRKRPVVSLIPGGGAAGSGAKVILDIVTLTDDKENERRRTRRAELLFFTVRETDEVA